MLIKPPADIDPSEITPRNVYEARRTFLRQAAALGLAGTMLPHATAQTASAAPVTEQGKLAALSGKASTLSTTDKLTPHKDVVTYNNYYEFGVEKADPVRNAHVLPIRPWEISFEGMVEKPFKTDFDTMIKAMPLEERLYRHRCVETWSFAAPWSGFPMKALMDYAKPASGAKYVVMKSWMNPEVAPAQNQVWVPWPYTEGLTLEEANNDLTFMVTGAYGKPLPKQNGAPLRLATPWKYGFKSTKGIQRFIFTDERPQTYWMALGSSEYGFWANVNPQVPHPRWSQAREEILGTGNRVPTLLYNGYGDQVASLYANMTNERLFM